MADASKAGSLMQLGWPQNSSVTIVADGPDAPIAVQRMREKIQVAFC